MTDKVVVILLGGLAGIGYLVAIVLCALAYNVVDSAIRRLRERVFPRQRNVGKSAEAARIRGRMTRLARPTLLMIPTKQPGFSKLGGEPDLPIGQAWPAGQKSSRAFLAQVDLAKVRAAEGPDWLPDEGRIYAFYDDQRTGFADLVQIIYSREPAGETAAFSKDVPTRLRFPERRVEFLRLRSIPSLDWLGVDVRELDDDVDLDELADLPDKPFVGKLQHRIGGYPSEIQEEQMALSCERLRRGLDPDDDEDPSPAILRASKAWRLLLQIDTDSELKMNWGGDGRIYVFIREQDAGRADFSKTITLFQCE